MLNEGEVQTESCKVFQGLSAAAAMWTGIVGWTFGVLSIVRMGEAFTCPSLVSRAGVPTRCNAVMSDMQSRGDFLEVASLTAAGALGLSTLGSRVSVAADSGTKPRVFETKGGVKFIVIKEGTGPTARDGDYCVVEFTGYLPDGKVFDSSSAPGRKPIAFKLGSKQVIPGWEEVLRLMNAGAEVQMVVPAKLGFGDKGICLENGECLVKPGTDLRYDLQLKRVAVPP